MPPIAVTPVAVVSYKVGESARLAAKREAETALLEARVLAISALHRASAIVVAQSRLTGADILVDFGHEHIAAFVDDDA